MLHTGLGRIIGAVCIASYSTVVLADQFHYRNFLIGDRAVGLGGAYAGVSDDASGAFYNPAGLAFALSNDVSGSANAIYTREVIYKETINDRDFKESSGGSSPTFFGGLQKLDNLLKGLVFAFGIYVLDSDQKDQDDIIENEELGPQRPCPVIGQDGQPILNPDGSEQLGPTPPNFFLDRFHRTVNQQATTQMFAVAVGYRLHPRLSIGAGLDFVTIDELVQEYQDVRTQRVRCRQDGQFASYIEQRGQNFRRHLRAEALQPSIGVQYVPWDRISLGLTLRIGSYIHQKFTQVAEGRETQLTVANQQAVDAAQGNRTDVSDAVVSKINLASESSNPLGSRPIELRLGLAVFLSTRLLMTADASYVGSVVDAGNITQVGQAYSKEAVLDFAAGLEYFVLPSLPLRVGAFTNFDARPEINKNKFGERDHIDYIGGSLFLAWVQPNSQIGAGAVLQQGSGEAQKISTSRVIQDVEANAFTFVFSATHSF